MIDGDGFAGQRSALSTFLPKRLAVQEAKSGTTRKKGLWPEWVGKPAPRAIAIRGVRCPAQSPHYTARLYRRDLTRSGPPFHPMTLREWIWKLSGRHFGLESIVRVRRVSLCWQRRLVKRERWVGWTKWEQGHAGHQNPVWFGHHPSENEKTLRACSIKARYHAACSESSVRLWSYSSEDEKACRKCAVKAR